MALRLSVVGQHGDSVFLGTPLTGVCRFKRIGATLRETLDYGLVLLPPNIRHGAGADSIGRIHFIVGQMPTGNGTSLAQRNRSAELIKPYTPDDFTPRRQSQQTARPRSRQHALRCTSQLIRPLPSRAWLRFAPLTSAETVTSAIVVQKFITTDRFTRWNHPIGRHCRSGQCRHQNARLHGEMAMALKLDRRGIGTALPNNSRHCLTLRPMGVLMVDHQRQIVLVNPTAAQFMGQPLAALQNNSQLEPETAATYLVMIRDQAQNRSGPTENGPLIH